LNIHGVPAHKFLVSRALWATGLGRLVTFQLEEGYRLRFYPSSISTLIWCTRDCYAQDAQVLAKYLRRGDTFVDVGANIGVHSLLAANLVHPEGRVYAIEPHPRTFRFLQGNIRLNKLTNVHAIQAAVGESEGTAYLTSKRGDDMNCVSKSGLQVAQRPLDAIIPDVPIRVLKIDVEGFELFALRGAQRILKDTEIIYFEACEAFFQRFGYSTSDVLLFLAQHGFETAHPPDYLPQRPENLIALRR
jgi:FkbM family methyltransferase